MFAFLSAAFPWIGMGLLVAIACVFLSKKQ